MPAPLIGALAQGVGGLLSFGSGLIQAHKGNKLLKGLQYPTEQLPDEYQQNQNTAQQMAATGMPAEQYNMAMKNIQRQQLMALRAANDRRGGLNVLTALLQGTNDATLNLDSANSQQRVSNQRNLMTVNNQVAGVKRDLFDRNIRDKYMRDYQYAMQLKGMGNQNLVGGVDKLAAGGLSLFANRGLGRTRTGTQETAGYDPAWDNYGQPG